MADGRIIARKVTSYADSGAYSRQSPYALTKHAANAAGPYAIPNVSIDAYCVYTNNVPASAMRGFGITMASYRDRGADGQDRRGRGPGPVVDPLHQRLPQRRYETARKVVEDATLIETMQAAAELVGHELPAELQGDDLGAAQRRRALTWPSCAAPASPPSTTRPA